MRKLLTLILLLLCTSGQAASLLSVQAATQTYSVIATTTADSVPTPRYAIRGATETYYTPLEASPASAGPRISIGGTTYGLASRTPAIGGNISLVRDASGTWVCHTFLTSGDFEVIDPAGIATCEYLIVAGGGGGGGPTGGGGGGGGGFRTNVGTSTPMVLAVGKYSAVVGAGGVTGSNYNVGGTIGATSSFNLIESPGGGGGGSQSLAGRAGGCGGGAGRCTLADSPLAGGTGSFGFAGGGAVNSGAVAGTGGSGGGGAGEVGESITDSTNGGDGGDGLLSSIRGKNEWFSGGGGGGYSGSPFSPGLGGVGGGGNSLTSGTANTGGGSGAGNLTAGKIGGSGFIAVRYLIEE